MQLENKKNTMMHKQRWLFPLAAIVLCLGLYAPVKAFFMEGSWFAPSFWQILPAVILLMVYVSVTGTGLGLLINRYEAVLQKRRQLIFGIVIGTVVCSFLVSGELLITLAVLILWIGELLLCDQKFPDIYADILSGIALALFIQLCFLDQNLQWMTSGVQWGKESGQVILSFHVWILCLMLPSILRLFCGDKIRKWIHKIFGIAVSVGSIVMTVLLICGAGVPANGQWYLSTEKEMSLSSNENVVVFVVDSLDAEWISTLMDEDAATAEMFHDFTFFDNVVPNTSETYYNLPLLLTGKSYSFQEDNNEFLTEAYTSSMLFSDLADKGYEIRIYTDKDYIGNGVMGTAPEGIDNLMINPEREVKDFGTLISHVHQLAGYYAVPYQYKQAFVFNTNKAEDNLPIKDGETYQIDNREFRKLLVEEGIDTSGEQKCFVIYHLEGVQKAEEDANENEEYRWKKGLLSKLKAISIYIDKMKEAGIYDNSLIMIIGGAGGEKLCQNPAVLVKRKGDTGPCTVNSNPMTFQNVRATFISGIIQDYNDKYGPDLFYYNENETENGRYIFVDEKTRNDYYPNQTTRKGYSRFLIGDAAGVESEFYEVGIPETYEYMLGEEILFYGDESNPEFKPSGLSGIESGHTWTDGTGAAMRFHIDEEYDDLKVDIIYKYLITVPQDLAIYANGRLVYYESLTSLDPISVIIPHDLVPDGDLELDFGLPDSTLLEVDSEIIDNRWMGIALESMTITSVSE